MKKIVSLALVICLCVGAMLALGSCGLFGGAIPTGVYESVIPGQEVTVIGSSLIMTQSISGETYDITYTYEVNEDEDEITLTIEEVTYEGDNATISTMLESVEVGDEVSGDFELGDNYFKIDGVKYVLDVD
ncbi:MAG: hypothetical protein IJW48_01190 [Clostridia bacterium]|nr:hypothetical protein [Clostridia bacterium]